MRRPLRVRAPALLTAAALATLAAAAGAPPAAAGELLYTGTLSGASGDYTLSEETTSVLLLTGLSYRTERWRLSGSIPLIYQDTPFLSYAGGTPVPTGRRFGDGSGMDGDGNGDGGGNGSRSDRGRGPVIVPDPDTLDFSETGVGDPLLRVDLEIARGGGSTAGVFASVKPPLADEDSGFGTGEWDAGGGVTFSRRAGAGLLLVELAYWSFGDLPDLELEDPFAASLAYGRPVGGGAVSWLAAVSGFTETLDGADGPVELSLTFSRQRPEGGRRLSLTVAAGLTETAADGRVALGWSVGKSREPAGAYRP